MKREFIFSLLCVVALIVITTPGGASPAVAADLYVDASATGSNNGTSWENAYIDLQLALETSGSTDTINVAEGTYKPTKARLPDDPDPRQVSFALRDGRTLLGGYPSGGGPRDPWANETILSGDIGIVGDESDNAYIVVRASTAVLDGFTISDGGGLYAGGGLNASGNVTVTNVTFTRNRTSAMYIHSGDVTLTNVTFSGNHTSRGPGGLDVGGNTTLTLTNVTFSDNSSLLGNAGGMDVINVGSKPNVTLTNVTFAGNWTLGNPEIGTGGGMYVEGGNATLTNVTFSHNYPNAIHISSSYWGNGTAEIRNTILWGNDSPIVITKNGSITIGDSVVQLGH